MVSTWLWLYFVVTIALSGATFLGWYMVLKRARKHNQPATDAKAVMGKEFELGPITQVHRYL
jgi:hypothetical protein